MSIRLLAVELYRLIKQVEELERKLENLPPTSPERQKLEDELRKARAERDRVRALLEGAKE